MYNFVAAMINVILVDYYKKREHTRNNSKKHRDGFI